MLDPLAMRESLIIITSEARIRFLKFILEID